MNNLLVGQARARNKIENTVLKMIERDRTTNASMGIEKIKSAKNSASIGFVSLRMFHQELPNGSVLKPSPPRP